MTFDLHRHGYRGTHAKSHGTLRGELRVHDDLPPELAQGLFARPATYPVVARIATETGQLDDDRSPNARGLALKVLAVAGETLHPSDPGHDVHDIHPLAHAYYTQSAFRYGDYVAKIAVHPGTPRAAGARRPAGR